MPISTRTSTSMVLPCGMNSGSMKEAMNSTEMSGTPRISSTYSTQMVRMPAILDCRPRATKMASGKAISRLTVDSMTVRGKPPQREVSTGTKPKRPPIISTKNAPSTRAHRPISQPRQKGR